MNLFRKIAIVVVVLALVAGGISFWIMTDLRAYAKRPTLKDAPPVVFEVRSGQRFQAIAANLVREGIVTSLLRLRVLARIKQYENRIKAGEYWLSPEMAPLEVLKVLVSGRVRLHRLTVPEGYTLIQIADRVAQAGFATRDQFLTATQNTGLLKSLGFEADSFEGYLFPDTYHFPRHATAKQIVATMLKRFQTVFKPAWREQAKALNLSPHEVVTLASIIEKETGAAHERPLIASVFHNRLQKKMRLESDPTVIYGINDFDGNLTRKHLRTHTPYNTYRISGLPPGPIANPGAKALEAALFPARTKFLFFVSKKDTTHQFSTNLRDHNRAVRKYQLGRRSARSTKSKS